MEVEDGFVMKEVEADLIRGAVSALFSSASPVFRILLLTPNP